MRSIEEQILSLVQEDKYISDYEDKLYAIPIGKLSEEFYENPRLKEYCARRREKKLSFRLALERYINSNRSQSYLDNVEATLLKLPPPILFLDPLGHNKKAGTYLLPIKSEVVRQIYLFEDEPLTNLFQKHFPLPPVRLFDGFQVPSIIQKKSIEIDETMKRINFEKIKPFVIKAQRHIRMKKRQQEEKNRIAARDEDYLKFSQMSPQDPIWNAQTFLHVVGFKQSARFNIAPYKPMSPEDLIQDANTPYKPKCNADLSKRIMAKAKRVAAFSTIKHMTTETAIKSIFDDALYGRRTLMDLYLSFKPASLFECDILNGDGNAVCLGPQYIDPMAHGDIVIEFDLPKIIRNKPAAFFKQRDLGYGLDKIREVQLGKETIRFDHTGFVRCSIPTKTYLKILNGKGEIVRIAQTQKSSLISYNLEQIHEILTLNFFRFMDKMTDLERNIDQIYIDNFYKKVGQLTDEELIVFLTDLEKNIADTAEFNFYGAHQIDFSTIIRIAKYDYSLNLAEFINDLNLGNINELRQARIWIPKLFESYRFLDYLLLQVQNLEARYYLDELRKQCKTPNWVKYTPLLVPENFEFHWDDQTSVAIHHKVIETVSAMPDSLEASNVELTKEDNLTLKPADDINVVSGSYRETHQEVIETASVMQDSNENSQVDSLQETNLTSQSIDTSITISSSSLKIQTEEVQTEEPFQDDPLNKELQTHHNQFVNLLGKLEEFSSYCSRSHDNTVLLYHPFTQELIKDFTEIGQNFFLDIQGKDKEALKRSFTIFQLDCERLSQKAENHFKLNSGIWSYVKPILTGFVGVIIAIAATLLTLGIATYYVAKNERSRGQYIDTFFRSESRAIQDAKNKWTQYSFRQTLFAGEGMANKGLVNKIEETISANNLFFSH